MESSTSVLSFYFDMLFVNSIENVKKSFIGNSTLLENDYSYLKEYDCYFKEEIYDKRGWLVIVSFVQSLIEIDYKKKKN